MCLHRLASLQPFSNPNHLHSSDVLNIKVRSSSFVLGVALATAACSVYVRVFFSALNQREFCTGGCATPEPGLPSWRMFAQEASKNFHARNFRTHSISNSSMGPLRIRVSAPTSDTVGGHLPGIYPHENTRKDHGGSMLAVSFLYYCFK